MRDDALTRRYKNNAWLRICAFFCVCVSVFIRGCQKFGIKIYWRLKSLKYFRTLHLKFQKALTKIEVVLSLPSWLSQLNWDSYQGRLRTTSILVRAFWNFKLKVLKYSRNCSLQYTLIPWSLRKCDAPCRSTVYKTEENIFRNLFEYENDFILLSACIRYVY